MNGLPICASSRHTSQCVSLCGPKNGALSSSCPALTGVKGSRSLFLGLTCPVPFIKRFTFPLFVFTASTSRHHAAAEGKGQNRRGWCGAGRLLHRAARSACASVLLSPFLSHGLTISGELLQKSVNENIRSFIRQVLNVSEGRSRFGTARSMCDLGGICYKCAQCH